MRKHFYYAVALGVLIGAVGMVLFGPFVQSRVQARAIRYGARVQVASYRPRLDGMHLRGVDVEVPEIPGLRVRFEDVLVGWDRRLKRVQGGRISAIGPVRSLLEAVERWRSHRKRGKAGQGGGATDLLLGDFELEWRSSSAREARTLLAVGLKVQREGDRVRLDAKRVEGKLDGVSLLVQGAEVEVERGEARTWRLKTLASQSMRLVFRSQASASLEAWLPSGGGVVPDGSRGGAAGGGSGATEVAVQAASARGKTRGPVPAASQAAKGAPARGLSDFEVDPRVRALELLLRRASAIGSRLDSRLAVGAKVALRGTQAKVFVGDEVLHLGPGTLAVGREGDRLIVALESDSAVRKEGSALAFRLALPIGGEAGLKATLRGGPIALTSLGIREGDLGLRRVDHTTVEADAEVELTAGSEWLRLKGRGKLRRLELESPRLAPEPVVIPTLAWEVAGEVRVNGREVRRAMVEVNVGDLRAIVRGAYQRVDEGHVLDVALEVPLVTCQRAFEGLPKALVASLEGMRFAGSFAAKGHARFDTRKLLKSFDVDYDGSLGCRVTEAPPRVNVARFKGRFEKLIYSPEGKERQRVFGPETDGWVPLNGISRFMPGAVLTTEDGRFFRHGGFDKEAIVNSLRENIRAGRFVRGASTISMQLAKNLYLPRTKTLARKLQEAVFTLYLEQVLTKEEIMELYLNVIEYGPMIYGIGPAARHYFNASPGRLSLSQALYLASILRNPKQQFFGAGGAVTPSHMRYLRVLMKIVRKIGRISDEELEFGLRETVVFGSPTPHRAPPVEDIYFDDHLGMQSP